MWPLIDWTGWATQSGSDGERRKIRSVAKLYGKGMGDERVKGGVKRMTTLYESLKHK